MAVPDKSVPDSIAHKAVCVGVVPGMKKGAFLVGGEYGQGVVTCRTGAGWSAPVFIRMAGGSFGFQIGGQGTDLVLVAVNDKGFQDLLHDKFKIGGDVSAAAGPVGRDAQAATDLKMRAELLTWSRSRGVFAGIDLNGVSVSQNREDTIKFMVALIRSTKFCTVRSRLLRLQSLFYMLCRAILETPRLPAAKVFRNLARLVPIEPFFFGKLTWLRVHEAQINPRLRPGSLFLSRSDPL